MRAGTFIATALSISLFGTASASAEDPVVMDGAELKVTSVKSGHQLVGKLEDGTKVEVRVIGIDCPDTKAGKKAKQAASRLAKKKVVALRGTIPGIPLQFDNHGRVVAYVELDDGEDFSKALLDAGQCTAAMWRIPHPRKALYAQLSK